MGILYGMVARGEVVLAEFSATQSNASVVAKQILNKINQGTENYNDSNLSFSHDRYVFHVRRNDGLTVLCMAEEAFGSMFQFLIFVFSSLLIVLGFWIGIEKTLIHNYMLLMN
jgi:vesicle-associated membrane protein 7